MDKKATVMGAPADMTVQYTEGGQGSLNDEMVSNYKQNDRIPSRQKATKPAQPLSTPTPSTPINKVAFLRGYLGITKNAAAFTGPMGNPGPVAQPPVPPAPPSIPPQLSNGQQYALQNEHGMGASTLQTVPTLKPPDLALEAAAKVGGSLSAKPFSGATADRKSDTNMQGASAMNSGNGMGISSTQRNKNSV